MTLVWKGIRETLSEPGLARRAMLGALGAAILTAGQLALAYAL